MQLTSRQFLVLESIIGEHQIQFKNIDNYHHIIEAIKNTRQLDNDTLEVDFNFIDIEIIQKIIIDIDFNIKDINFVIELISLLGLVNILEPSINKLKGVFMFSNYKYVGSEPLSIIVKGICTTIMPDEPLKLFFLPFFKKNYPERIKEIIEPEIEIKPINVEPETVSEVIYEFVSDELEKSPIYEIAKAVGKDTNESQTQHIKFDKTNSESTFSYNNPIEVKKYPYKFQSKLLNSYSDIKSLFKEELQTLSMELGLPSEVGIAKLRSNVHNMLLIKD